MAYSTTTLASARSQLLERLQDQGAVYFGDGGSPANLNRWIVEAVRTWQALTASYKDRASFNTVSGTSFYDLPTVLSATFGYSVTDADIVNSVLAHLLEPVLSGAWVGSGQFSFSSIIAAVEERTNRFAGDSGVMLTRITQAMTSDRVLLPSNVTDVRRAAWITGASVPSVLWRDDQYAMSAFRFNAAPVDVPSVYGMFTLSPVGFQVYPPPTANGTAELIVVQATANSYRTAAQVFASPSILGVVPDDFSFAITYGVLADVLSQDGPGKDLPRAAYAESRYQEAIEAAKLNPSVLQTFVAGYPTWTGSLFELDSYQTAWQSTPGTPGFIGMAGRNLLATGPKPDGVYSITLDLVRNMPVPVLDADYLQVDTGHLDQILDFSQHLASFRLGGAEFAVTQRLRQNFLNAAMMENSRLKNSAFFKPELEKPSRLQPQEVVRI